MKATEQAFPGMAKDCTTATGLTKIEWFSGMALQGLCANPELSCMPTDQTAECAVNHAKAMIRALEEEEGQA